MQSVFNFGCFKELLFLIQRVGSLNFNLVRKLVNFHAEVKETNN